MLKGVFLQNNKKRILLIADPSKIGTFFGVNKWLNLSKNRTIVRKLHNAREVNNSLYITKIT